jgi:predicted aspartyl protease
LSKLTVLSIALITFLSGNIESLSKLTQDQTDQVAVARRRVREAPGSTEFATPVVSVSMLGSKTLPLVEAKLNGAGPYKLLVDSGANVTLLQMRVADELKLPVLRPGETSKLVSLESLQIGDARFRDLVVGVRSWGENIDGVIGFNLFANCLLTMDYPRQKIILKKGVLPPVNEKDIFSYSLIDRCPGIELIIGNQRKVLLIDTGAVQGVVIPDVLASKLRFAGGLVPGPNLSTFYTPKSRAMVGRLSGSIRIGIHEISEPTIYIWSEEVPIIGSGLLQDFVLTFDQKNKTVRISV